jgi:hypothetical protein
VRRVSVCRRVGMSADRRGARGRRGCGGDGVIRRHSDAPTPRGATGRYGVWGDGVTGVWDGFQRRSRDSR